MLLQRVALSTGFLHRECQLPGNSDQICNVFNAILLYPPRPPPGGCFNHGERGGPRPGRLRQHVRAQQLQTRPPSSTTGPVGRNAVLPGTRYSAGLLFVPPPHPPPPSFLSVCSTPLLPSPSLRPLAVWLCTQPRLCLHSIPSQTCSLAFLSYLCPASSPDSQFSSLVGFLSRAKRGESGS